MSRYETFSNHPLIPNSQEYTIEKKYVSIHSEDRNVIKYPHASDFEIELPQDYINVSTIKLSTWSFPSNYDAFSTANQNTAMTFRFTSVYDPSGSTTDASLNQLINVFLTNYKNANYGTPDFVVVIHPGFYNPTQLATELTNQMNLAVTTYLSDQLAAYDLVNGSSYDASFLDVSTNSVPLGGYNDFVVVYNEVEQRLYFGNRSSGFSLTQNLAILKGFYAADACYNKSTLPDNSVFGLPSYLGLTRCDLSANMVTGGPLSLPRFTYCDATNNCCNGCSCSNGGYWLTPNPDLSGCIVSYVAAPYKLNNMGPAYFYLELDGLNYIDETSPYNRSGFTSQTNQTNGIVNASFAKIAVTSTPLSQFYDNTMECYKYFSPPAERIRKLRVRLRYHNGQPVDFGHFPFSFTLEFTLFTPQILRNLVATKSFTTL